MISAENAASLFFKMEGDKKVIQKKRIYGLCIIFFIVCVFIVLAFGEKKDTSTNIVTSEPIEDRSNISELKDDIKEEESVVTEMLNSSTMVREDSQIRTPIRSANPVKVPEITYKATQVIQRKDPTAGVNGLPIGTNMIGQLLTTIDTREKTQIYKVLLPYGGKGKADVELPENTILFGNISYPGSGDKVFLTFSKALLPDGSEKTIKAQALGSKDYAPGIMGEFHGKSAERISATLGLAMISAMSETLTEKESLGVQGESVTPKATLKNAGLQGIAKVSEMESQRQAANLVTEPEYVTVYAGKDIIVSLLETYYGEK